MFEITVTVCQKISNITTDTTHMLTCMLMLIYPHNTTLPRITETNRWKDTWLIVTLYIVECIKSNMAISEARKL